MYTKQNYIHSSSNEYDYQFIQKSRLPSLHFQASLPRLPIPELEKTKERYLNAQKPLLGESSEEFKTTVKCVNEFFSGEGLSLQKELIATDKANKHTNYISGPWFDMYLKDRVPLPINYNPFLVLVNDPKPAYNDQTIRATNMMISSLRLVVNSNFFQYFTVNNF
jgi:carnitine O-palmitoyltransferase 2